MKIADVALEPLKDSQYVKTYRIRYQQAGREKTWEAVEVHNSVAVLLYHRERESLVLVKQIRPPVYLVNGDGTTYELCAGLVDKDLPLSQVVQEEIEEECGYYVPIDSIRKITSFYTAVGFAGSQQHLFFAEIDDAMKTGEGGGIDTEMIEVVYLPLQEAKSFIFDEKKAKTPGLMFAFQWFFEYYEA